MLGVAASLAVLTKAGSHANDSCAYFNFTKMKINKVNHRILH